VTLGTSVSPLQRVIDTFPRFQLPISTGYEDRKLALSVVYYPGIYKYLCLKAHAATTLSSGDIGA